MKIYDNDYLFSLHFRGTLVDVFFNISMISLAVCFYLNTLYN